MRYRFYKVVLNDVVVGKWWVEHLDLILDDEKFDETSGWNKGNKKKLTTTLKKRMGDRLQIIRLKEGYAQKHPAGHRDYTEFASFTCDGSVCVSLFRHIRNAIAHKRVELQIHDRQRFYYFCDYSAKGELTAEILISHDTLRYFCARYDELAHQPPARNARAA